MEYGIDILIAEDDETDRFLVSRAFSKDNHNFQLTFARDGQEAIEHLQSLPEGQSAKLLLLDLKMPRMDGFQVLEWLLTNPARRPERVVVLSSSVDPTDTQRTRQLGADLQLTKPHDARDYVRIAQGLVDQIPRTSQALSGVSQPRATPAT